MEQLSKFWLLLVLVLVLPLSAIPSSAELPMDTLGLYFDTEADRACAEGVMPFTILTMYLTYSNPSIPELNGFELGMTVVGTGATYLGSQIFCGLPITLEQMDLEQIQVACGEAQPCVQHTILMTLEWLYNSTTAEMVLFYLHGARDPSEPGDLPLILPGDGSFLAVGVNEIGTASNASGAITGMFDVCYPLAAGEKSWDSLKSLYR